MELLVEAHSIKLAFYVFGFHQWAYLIKSVHCRFYCSAKLPKKFLSNFVCDEKIVSRSRGFILFLWHKNDQQTPWDDAFLFDPMKQSVSSWCKVWHECCRHKLPEMCYYLLVECVIWKGSMLFYSPTFISEKVQWDATQIILQLPISMTIDANMWLLTNSVPQIQLAFFQHLLHQNANVRIEKWPTLLLAS